jgi:diacylglycerol kinase family enzyme
VFAVLVGGMKTLQPKSDAARVPPSVRWLARLAIVATAAAVCVVVAAGTRGIAVLLVGVIAVCAVLAGGWWFIAHRGLVRLLGAALVVAVPVAAIALYLSKHLFWAAIALAVLVIIAAIAARAASRLMQADVAPSATAVQPPRHAVLIMNPRSGGGKVARFALDTRARELGADVVLLDGDHQVDVAALARTAVAEHADLLGVAGGDGTQALVAGIAAANDIAFTVISAGTRNHFAMDLGLDRDHAEQGLRALSDGAELRVDLGDINGRAFVNNASFGAYAAIVQSPAYRNDKRGTTLKMLPDLLSGHAGPSLTVRVDGLVIEGLQALLVSNNPYELSDLAGLGRRARLDTGKLGVVAVNVANTADAVGLMRGASSRAVRHYEALEVVVEADAERIPVGVDGEALLLEVPVRCTIRPGALRVVVPREGRRTYRAVGSMELRMVLREAAGLA